MKTKKSKLIISCALAAVIILIAFVACSEKETDKARVYANGSNAITLNVDLSFDAKLAHGVSKAGTYSESTDASGVTTITFTADGETASGTIQDGVLTIPHEWEDSHGHGNTFTLQD